MAIRWWDPWSDLLQTSRMMDRVFDQFFGAGGSTSPEERTSELPTYQLPLDIEDRDDAFVLTAPVPGFTPDQVDVKLDEGVLTIHAQAAPFVPMGRWIRRERMQGSLIRRLELPKQVQGEGIAAAVENGLLTVTVPKAAKPEPVRIPVNGQKQLTGSTE